MNELPEGWGSAAIGELITSIDAGKNIRCVERPPLANEIGVVKVSAVSWGRFDPEASKTLPAEFKPSPHTRIRKGDFLFSRANTIDLVGACVVVDTDPGNLYLSDKILRLNLSNENKLWLLWFLRSPVGRSALEAASSGNQHSMRNISQANFLNMEMLVAPLAEQRRIVAKLHALSACSKRARAELDRINPLILRKKKAILRKTFAGELTSAWRAERGLPEPSTVSLRELCRSITDGDHQAPPRSKSGVPFITISAMNDGRIQLSKATRYVPMEYATQLSSARRPAPGDVLYSVTGSIGIPAFITTSETFVFQRHIAILKPDLGKTTGRFIATVLGAPQIIEQALAVATGTAQLTIPLSGLRNFRVPLPTELEQAEIIRRVDTAFTNLGRLAAEARSAAALLDRLDQAVLAKAFRGELVPQNPNDEPASVLLKPIRAGRAAEDKPASHRRRLPRMSTGAAR